jgi:hypothetical protein
MKRNVFLAAVATAFLSMGCPAEDPPMEMGDVDDDDDDDETGGEQITSASDTAGTTPSR